MARLLRPRFLLPIAALLFTAGWLLQDFGAPPRIDPFARPGAPIILITVEGLRWDYQRFASLPHLENLERESIAFRSALTPSPLSLPAHVSIWTGDTPLRHRMRGAVSGPLPDGVVTLAEAIRSHGYRTGAVVSSPLLDHRFGLAQGFDQYDDLRQTGNRRSVCAAGSLGSVTKRAIAWIGAESDGPFFVWIQYRLPPFEARRLPEPRRVGPLPGPGHYASGLLLMDEELGRLFRYLHEQDLWEESFLVLAGAHGEALGEFDETGHGVYLSPSTVRVPILLKLARGDQQTAGDIAAPVSLIDLRPTLLRLAGVADAHQTDGRNLLPLLHGAEPAERSLFLESTYPRDQFGGPVLRGLRDGPYFYLEGWRGELQYHPQGGDGPDNPLVWDPERERRMAAELARIAAEREAMAGPPISGEQIDRDYARALRECGHFPERTGAPIARAAPLPAARAIELQAWLTRARGLLGRGALSRAARVLREAVGLDPENADLIHLLGLVRWQQEKWDDAELFLRTALELDPLRPERYEDLARLLRDRDQADLALPILDAGITRIPDSVVLRNEVAVTRAVAGDPGGAEVAYRQALDRAPRNSTALRGLARLERARGALVPAVERLREVVRWEPGSVAVRIELGEVLLERGMMAIGTGENRAGRESLLEAIGEFRTVLLRDPDHPGARRGVGVAREWLGPNPPIPAPEPDPEPGAPQEPEASPPAAP